ncbi:nitroreductase family protein [Butyrivibrio sp. WCD2001]|uniref:nitroreductase family protein n=1 Tax=Butyrivibrio sp. WCD2001 TaxID=1280681 RepID=UPI00041E7AD8|nr:nitroreductase family protein [Butyrivibrio sp. WCD2001]
MSNFLELAKTRRSVRTFDGNMPSAQVLDELKAFAENIENPYGAKIRFVFLNAEENKLSSPVLSGEKVYVSAVTSKQEHVEEAYGYSFEKLLIKAHELGLGTVWIGGTMPREKFEAASGLEEGEFMPCISPLGTTAKRMSVKETLMRKGVKADFRHKFEELFFVGDFGTPMSEEYAKEHGIYDALEAVRIAPSAVNKQPWRVVIAGDKAHFYEKHDKGFTTPDYDLQKIDVGIAIYHFESQLISEGKAPELIVQAPAITAPDQIDYVATYKI